MTMLDESLTVIDVPRGKYNAALNKINVLLTLMTDHLDTAEKLMNENKVIYPDILLETYNFNKEISHI